MNLRSFSTLLAAAAGALLVSCAGLPALAPLPRSEQETALDRCLAPFHEVPFRVVHRIEAELPFDNAGALLGVTVADPPGRRFRSVLISVEGVTLFDATRQDEATVVHRALPPLDRPGFGEGLLDDVALMLLVPPGTITEIGRREDNRSVCRFRRAAGGVVDVVPEAEQGFSLFRYDAGKRLLRQVAATAPAADGFSREVNLRSFGLGSYTLRLSLSEAEDIEAGDDLFRR